MKHQHTVADIIRMTGHLLEHHPGTGQSEYVEQGKACFCIIGAHGAVAKALGRNSHEFEKATSEIYRMCTDAATGLVKVWEGKGTTDESRLAIAKKLQAYE